MRRPHLTWFFFGRVRVRVDGSSPEQLINLCLRNQIPVDEVTSQDGVLYFSTIPAAYKRIRPLARKTRQRPRIVSKWGLPFFLLRLCRRKAAVAAFMLMCSAILYLSGFVLSIEVTGNLTVSTDAVMQVLKSEGLVVGARKSFLNPEHVQSQLTLKIPGVSWAYVHFEGTRAIVEIVEMYREAVDPPGDLVARREGVVDSILVLSGIPLAKPGQTVRKGEILIAGDPSSTVGAKGTVTAHTWYLAELEIPLEQTELVRTGNKVSYPVVRLSGREFELFGSRRLYQWYEVEDYRVFSIGKGSEVPVVEYVSRTIYELEWKETRILTDEVKPLAEKRAREAIARQLPSGAKLIDFSCELSTNGSVVKVRALASVLEDIAVIKPWQFRENGGR